MTLKPKIYLETSVFNYYFLVDHTRGEETSATKKLFDNIKRGEFEPFVSSITVQELEQCRDIAKKEKMLNLIEKSAMKEIVAEDFSDYLELAEKYILAGAIPSKKRDDAFHIAVATLSGMDILISWNCAHIVRFRTQQIVRTINIVAGLNDIAINTPREVIDYG